MSKTDSAEYDQSGRKVEEKEEPKPAAPEDPSLKIDFRSRISAEAVQADIADKNRLLKLSKEQSANFNTPALMMPSVHGLERLEKEVEEENAKEKQKEETIAQIQQVLPTSKARRSSMQSMDLAGISASKLDATISHQEVANANFKNAFSKVQSLVRLGLAKKVVSSCREAANTESERLGIDKSIHTNPIALQHKLEQHLRKPPTLRHNNSIRNIRHSRTVRKVGAHKAARSSRRKSGMMDQMLEKAAKQAEEIAAKRKAISIAEAKFDQMIDQEHVDHIHETNKDLLRKKRAGKARAASFDATKHSDSTMLRELRVFYDKRHKLDEHHEILVSNDHLYTDKALLQREAIKFDTKVQATLRTFFKLVDADASGEISKEEYKILSHKMYIALKAFWDHELADLTDEEMDEIAEEDWTTDSAGKGSLNKEQFVTAMFQLCDVWVDFIDGQTYDLFLTKLMDMVSEVNIVTGERVYRLDEDIKHHAEEVIDVGHEQLESIFKSLNRKIYRWEMTPCLADILCYYSRGQIADRMLHLSPERTTEVTLRFINANLMEHVTDEVEEVMRIVEASMHAAKANTRTQGIRSKRQSKNLVEGGKNTSLTPSKSVAHSVRTETVEGSAVVTVAMSSSAGVPGNPVEVKAGPPEILAASQSTPSNL